MQQDNDIRYLRKRVDYLEAQSSAFQLSLQAIKGLVSFQRKIGSSHDLSLILEETSRHISQFLRFKLVAFLLCDNEQEFKPHYVMPQFLSEELTLQIDKLIENGDFAWALNQTSSITKVKATHFSEPDEIFLHPLATDTRVLGMFVGHFSEDPEKVTRESLDLLNIALVMTSFSLENARLYLELEEYNKELEKRVEAKTAEVMAINRDLREEISTRKKIEQQLVLAKEAAEASSQAKGEFLMNMSHEIRTPLNAIIGMTELLMDSELSEEQRENLNSVNSASGALLSMLNDILEFSQIDAGLLEPDEHLFDLMGIVEDSVEMLSLDAHSKGLEMATLFHPGVPQQVIADEVHIRQVLIKLIGNAVKFTEKGEVKVTVEPDPDATATPDQTRAAILFTVSDTGIGISPSDHDKIFEKFTQADGTSTRKYGGTGLGLSISKRLVEMMGGEINVNSRVGSGSTFSFRLTVKVPPERQSPDIWQQLLSDKSVVCVCNPGAIKSVLETTLSHWGFSVRTISDKKEFIDLNMSGCDLLILDEDVSWLNDAVISGGISRALKIPVMLLSKLGSTRFDSQGGAGCIRIRKPARQTTLYDKLKEIFQSGPGVKKEKATAATTATESVPPQRILVVEDNPDNQNLIDRIFRNSNYDVEIVGNGNLAVEATSSQDYSAILMDIQMPVMDGFEATRKIRQAEAAAGKQRVPIIALTAHAIQDYYQKCLDQEMDDYLTKPLKKKLLFQKLEKWLESRED